VKEIKILGTLPVHSDFRLRFLSYFHCDVSLELEDCTTKKHHALTLMQNNQVFSDTK